MPKPLEQEVFGDYAAFLRTLLPQSRGFVFHNRDGQILWHDDFVDVQQLDPEYLENLRLITATGHVADELKSPRLFESNVFMFDLNSVSGHTLGFLAVILEPAFTTLDWDACAQRLHAAIRSLCRELSLRVKLREVSTNLAAQSNQYEFLHRIDDISRSQQHTRDALVELANLCNDKFVLDGTLLYLPRHNLHVTAGRKPVSELEAEMLFESYQAEAEDSGEPVALLQRRNSDPRARTRVWPVLDTNSSMVGLLIFSKPVKTSKWGPGTDNLASFVISTIQRILEHGFDDLTGLTNWSGLEVSLEQARSRPEIEYSVMYFDLDQLHVINDTFGRAAGDRILRGFGDILRHELDGHTVARVTSDSFAALISDCSLSDGEQFGKLICEKLHKLEFSNGSKAHRPTVSIGIASLDPSAPESNDALAHAQVACQAAKDRGRDRVETYHSADASIIRRMDDISLIGALRNAVEQGQLVLYAQPIVPVAGALPDKHYELLVRLLDENGSPIEPSKFLGTAERYQLIQDIDRWVVSKALEALAKRPTLRDGSNLYFAINLSGQSLGNEKFLEFLLSELSQHAVDPSRLCFEITETVAVSNQAKAQKFIRELKGIGCQFSLDDFGTGLSSFAYLKLFEVDKIKIDGSFVHDIRENEVSRAMVSAIAGIGRVMGIETVAEYVSDAASLGILRDIGVDWAQGFHVGEPFRLSKLISEAVPRPEHEDDAEYIDTVILQALPG